MNDRVNLGPAGALRAGPFSRNVENGAAPWGKGGVGEASGTRAKVAQGCSPSIDWIAVSIIVESRHRDRNYFAI
jgi:hypothetical protein